MLTNLWLQPTAGGLPGPAPHSAQGMTAATFARGDRIGPLILPDLAGTLEFIENHPKDCTKGKILGPQSQSSNSSSPSFPAPCPLATELLTQRRTGEFCPWRAL